MSNTQFESLAVLISSKLNQIVGKVNENTSGKADLDGADFTGNVSFNQVNSSIVPSVSDSFEIGSSTNMYKKVNTTNLNISNIGEITVSGSDVIFKNNTIEGIRILEDGRIRIGNSYNLPSSDGTLGQVFATDGNGNIIFKTLENESSDFAQYIIDYNFTSDGVTTSYTVNATSLNKIIYVELNGLIQKQGVDFTVEDKTITFSEPPLNGTTGTIKFWGNDITSVISSTDFVSDGVSKTFAVDGDLNKVVLVEVNGLIQKQGVNYTVNTTNNTITFSESLPIDSTGTIVHV